MANLLLCASIALLVLSVHVSAQSASTAAPVAGCPTFNFNGRTIDPNKWVTPGTYNMSFTSPNGNVWSDNMRLSICNASGSYFPSAGNKAPPGYAVFENTLLSFNAYLYKVKYNDAVILHFGGADPTSAGNFFHVNVSCCPSCKSGPLTLLTSIGVMEGHSWQPGTNTYTVSFGSSDLCGPFPTSVPPGTTFTAPTIPTNVPTPPPMTPSPTAPPQDLCTPFQFAGMTIDPNTWNAVSSAKMSITNLNNSDSYWAINLCSPSMKTRTGQMGFVVSQPVNGSSASIVEDMSYPTRVMRYIQKNSTGGDDSVVWYFRNDASKSGGVCRYVSVHVMCAPSPFVTFMSRQVNVFSTMRCRYYHIHLGVSALCPKPGPKPSSRCAPFQVTPTQTVDPAQWNTLKGQLLFINTGARVLASIDICHVDPSQPSPRGFVTLRGLNASSPNSTVAFDLQLRMAYYSALNQFRARYESTVSPTVLNDRVEITVGCQLSGGSDDGGLNFQSSIVFGYANELGGTTWQVQLETTSICVKAIPTLPPPRK